MIFVGQVSTDMNERVFATKAVVDAPRHCRLLWHYTVVEAKLNISRVVQIDPKARSDALNGNVSGRLGPDLFQLLNVLDDKSARYHSVIECGIRLRDQIRKGYCA